MSPTLEQIDLLEKRLIEHLRLTRLDDEWWDTLVSEKARMPESYYKKASRFLARNAASIIKKHINLYDAWTNTALYYVLMQFKISHLTFKDQFKFVKVFPEIFFLSLINIVDSTEKVPKGFPISVESLKYAIKLSELHYPQIYSTVIKLQEMAAKGQVSFK